MKPELKARLERIEYRMNQAVDSTDSRKVLGAVVLALGNLTEVVAQLAEHIDRAGHASAQASNVASCLANGIIPD